MITINIMFILKIISLCILGFMMLAYIISTFKQQEKISFIIIFFTFLILALPFTYILLN